MNVVLYTRDFEPITVLDLPLWLLETLEKQGAIRVAVQEPLVSRIIDGMSDLPAPLDSPQMKTVAIRCEKLRWRDGSLKPILVTEDEELALILRPEWLPGQQATVNQYKQNIRILTQQLIKAIRKS